MNPICAQVDQARATFTLTRVVMTSAATTAVMVPMSTRSACAIGARAMKGARRIITKPPMFTTPACSRADTGVGASITWMSQP